MRSFRTIALLAALAIPAAAYADSTIDYFTITGGGNTLTFSLPVTPSPSTSFDYIFYVDDVPVVFNGVSELDTIGFFTTDSGGGFTDTLFGDPFSDSFFNDDTENPTFNTDTYTFSDQPDGPASGTVVISSGPVDAPEPSSLFLLGTGALGLAGMVRRRIAA